MLMKCDFMRGVRSVNLTIALFAQVSDMLVGVYVLPVLPHFLIMYFRYLHIMYPINFDLYILKFLLLIFTVKTPIEQ